MTNTNRRTKSEGQRAFETVKKVYPDVYITPGIGLCGPDWEAAQAMYRELLTKAGL